MMRVANLQAVPRKGKKNNESKTATHDATNVATIMLKHIPVFPARKIVKGLLYNDSYISATSTSGVLASYVYSANGLYDPNITGTGHQPMGFDQMMLFYEQYTVISSTISVTAASGTTGSTSKVALYLSPDATSLTSFSRVIENGLAKICILDPPIYGTTAHNKMDLNCDCVKYFGHKDADALVANPQMAGDVSNNPGEQVYYIIAQQEFTESGNNTVVYLVSIAFDVIFWEPKKLTAS